MKAMFKGAMQKIRQEGNALILDRRGDAIGWLIGVVITVVIAGIVISLAVPAAREWWGTVGQRIMTIFNFT